MMMIIMVQGTITVRLIYVAVPGLVDHTGIDRIRVEYPNGVVNQYEYNFRWSWENYAQTSIRMLYGPNDVSYLDDVYIGGNRLSGYLDGRNNFVEFQGKR